MKSQIVKRFESLAEFVAYGTAQGAHYVGGYGGGFSEDFAGGSRQAVAAYMARGASEAEQAPVRAMLEKVNASMEERTRREWTDDMVGAYVNVPEFLMGLPECMRRQEQVESEAAPVRLYVDMSTSASVSPQAIAARGAAIVALIMRLSETRAVQVFAVAANTVKRTDVGVCVRLDTTPVNMSMLTAVFTSPQCIRGVRLSAQARLNNADGTREGFPWTFGHNPSVREAGMRRMFGIEPHDIYVAGGSGDWMDQWMRDPAAWVNAKLDHQRKLDEAA